VTDEDGATAAAVLQAVAAPTGPVAGHALIAAALGIEDVLRQCHRVGGQCNEQRGNDQLHERDVATKKSPAALGCDNETRRA
jgi:hypothetical protein